MLKNTEDKVDKVCDKCNKRLSLDKFYKNQHNNPEKQCKKCRNTQERKDIDIGNNNLFIS